MKSTQIKEEDEKNEQMEQVTKRNNYPYEKETKEKRKKLKMTKYLQILLGKEWMKGYRMEYRPKWICQYIQVNCISLLLYFIIIVFIIIYYCICQYKSSWTEAMQIQVILNWALSKQLKLGNKRLHIMLNRV